MTTLLYETDHVSSIYNNKRNTMIPCYPSGSLVLTKTGYISIQALDANELVSTHLGEWIPVVRKNITSHVGVIVSIITAGSAVPLRATADHQFLTKQIIGTGFGPKDFELSQRISWTPASALKVGKHMLCMPIDRRECDVQITINIDEESRTPQNIDWFMVGFYVGKGNHVLDVEFIPPGWNILREFTFNPNTENIYCNRIPEWMQRLPIKCVESFLKGFESSSNTSNGFATTNELVALCIQRLYAKIDQFVSIRINIDLITLIPMSSNLVAFDNEYMYIPIVEISDKYRESKAIELDMGGDYSYVIENLTTR